MNNLGYLDGYLLKTAGVGSLLGKLNPKRVLRSFLETLAKHKAAQRAAKKAAAFKQTGPFSRDDIRKLLNSQTGSDLGLLNGGIKK